MKLARRIFPWCDKPNQHTKACFYYHIDQCPGTCLGKITAKEYQQNIRQLTLFLKGRSKQVQTELKTQMRLLSKNNQYEQAAKIRDQLRAIEAVTSQPSLLKPDLSTPGLTKSWPTNTTAYLKRLVTQYSQLPDAYQLNRIEGYDVSNTSGQLGVVSMVVFEHGQKTLKEYRLFNIKTIHTPNDYQMMKEALYRRSNHPEWQLPDLIIIDGGRGQLKAALTAWSHKTPIISLAKNPDRLIIPVLNKNRKPITYHELKLPGNHPALQLTQAIRDESHRFSHNHHTKRRLKQLIDPYFAGSLLSDKIHQI
jgi:excinuclease ABC subunit C